MRESSRGSLSAREVSDAMNQASASRTSEYCRVEATPGRGVKQMQDCWREELFSIQGGDRLERGQRVGLISWFSRGRAVESTLLQVKVGDGRGGASVRLPAAKANWQGQEYLPAKGRADGSLFKTQQTSSATR